MVVVQADPHLAAMRPVSPESARSIGNLTGDAIALSVLLLIAVFATTGWFSADEVVLRQQSTTLAVDGSWTVPGDRAAVRIDPDQRFALLARTDGIGNEIVPYGKHPLLPGVLSVFQRTIPGPGLYIPGALAALAAALIVAAVRGWSRPGFWIVGLGTPLLFHATVLWGHAHAAAFSALALLGVGRICGSKKPDPIGLAALTAGLVGASLLRSEGLLLAASCAFAFSYLAVTSKTNRYAAIVAPLPLIVAVAVYFGEPVLRELLIGGNASPLGPSSGEGLTLSSRLGVAQIMLLQPSLGGATLGNLRLVGLMCMIVASYTAWRQSLSAKMVSILASVGAIGYLLGSMAGPSPALFVTMPLLLVALPWARFTTPIDRVVGVTCVSFAFGVVLTSYENAGGGDWGARYLFIGVPFLAALGIPAIARAWRDPRGRSVVIAGVVATGAIQGGILLDFAGRGETLLTVDNVAASIRRQADDQPDSVVAVTDERLARFLYDSGLRGASFYVPVDNETEFETLLERAGVAWVIWVDLDSTGPNRSGQLLDSHGSVVLHLVER